VRQAGRTVARAGTYTVSVSLTAAAKKRLRSRHRLTAALTVRYSPPGGRASAARVSITVKSQATR